MAGISKRIFGSEIPPATKKKLEAYQKLAEGPQNPGDPIGLQPGEPNVAENNYNFDDLVNFNFDGELDLSSRTPFARLWTAVQIRKHTRTNRGPWARKTKVADVRRGKFDEYAYVTSGDNLIEKKISKHDTMVYEIGNHKLHRLSKSPN